jgi:DNA polymerase-3 subunit gamma/tau
VAAAPVAAAPAAVIAQRPAPTPLPTATPAAPLLRTPPARAVATATVAEDDGPPWTDDEPEELMDDLPAPTRGRNGNAPPPVQRARPGLDELEPEYDDEPAPRQAAPQGVAPPPALPQFERTELGTRWYALINQCAEAGKLVAMVRALAMQSELVHCETGGEAPAWRLRVALETLRNPALADKLSAILRELTGQPLQLVVEIGEPQDTPLKRDAAEADRRQRAAIDEIQSDATVRALLAQFQTARILPGSVKPL